MYSILNSRSTKKGIILPYFTNEGRTLYYYTIGKGRPIYFIHGHLGSSWKHWRFQLRSKKLYSRYQLISYDIRGFGLSSIRLYEAPETNQILSDTFFFLNKVLKVGKPLIIIGYSVGAILAIAYALLFPKKVNALVLLSPVPFMFPRIQSYRIPKSRPKKTLDNISIINKLVWNRFKERNRAFISQITSQLYKKPNNLLTQLKSIKIPIYLIYGTHDSIVPQETFALLEKYLPEDSIVETYPLDHGISHEHPKLFNFLLLDFCEKLNQDFK